MPPRYLFPVRFRSKRVAVLAYFRHDVVPKRSLSFNDFAPMCHCCCACFRYDSVPKIAGLYCFWFQYVTGVMLASSAISYRRSPILLSGRFRTNNMPFDVPVSHRFRAVRIVPEKSKPATLSTNSQRKSTKKTTLVRNRTSISIPVRKKKPKHRH